MNIPKPERTCEINWRAWFLRREARVGGPRTGGVGKRGCVDGGGWGMTVLAAMVWSWEIMCVGTGSGAAI